MREGTHVRRHDPGRARYARLHRPRRDCVHAVRRPGCHARPGCHTRPDGGGTGGIGSADPGNVLLGVRPGHEFDLARVGWEPVRRLAPIG
jgi:hypothetical protein